MRRWLEEWSIVTIGIVAVVALLSVPDLLSSSSGPGPSQMAEQPPAVVSLQQTSPKEVQNSDAETNKRTVQNQAPPTPLAEPAPPKRPVEPRAATESPKQQAQAPANPPQSTTPATAENPKPA